MLSLHGNREKAFLDLSAELLDELDWKAGTLRTVPHHLDITALAYEAVSEHLAVGALVFTALDAVISSSPHRDMQRRCGHLRRAIARCGTSPGIIGTVTDTKSQFRILAL